MHARVSTETLNALFPQQSCIARNQVIDHWKLCVGVLSLKVGHSSAFSLFLAKERATALAVRF